MAAGLTAAGTCADLCAACSATIWRQKLQIQQLLSVSLPGAPALLSALLLLLGATVVKVNEGLLLATLFQASASNGATLGFLFQSFESLLLLQRCQQQQKKGVAGRTRSYAADATAQDTALSAVATGLAASIKLTRSAPECWLL
jgi:hypothetical protein